MCKEQTSVSHSSTESEIISLDAGLRMDGIPALDLWDVVIEVLHSSSNKKSSTQGAAGHCSPNSNTKLKRSGNRNVDEVSKVDHIVPNASSSQFEVQLNMFENSEAAIKMIIKGRSPLVRHMSRTHRVALDGLFDRINLDTKIQIKNVDTKNQLADLLTKGSFTRDQWKHLLRLFNIMNFSISSCSHFCKQKAEHHVEERARSDFQ